MTENLDSLPDAANDAPTAVKKSFFSFPRLLICTCVLAAGAVLLALILPLVIPDTRPKMCQHNLNQIMVALHNYHIFHQCYPPAYTVDKNGKPLHSWRTLILPYVHSQKLYDSIDLSKPWDDPVNAAAFNTSIPAYRCPTEWLDKTSTTYQAIVGPRSVFGSQSPIRIPHVSDGLSNTVFVVEVGPEKSVHWMSPVDHGYEFLKNWPASTKTTHPNGTHAAFGDTVVRFLRDSLDRRTREALITINGGEQIGDW